MITTDSAQIIPFPNRRAGPDEADTDQHRLSRAIANLNTALEQQRVAVAAWRASLAELDRSVCRLGAGMRQYQDSLAKAGDSVAALGGQARHLEQWADGVLAQEA